MTDVFDVVIVGGGTAGITVAARLLGAKPELTVAVLEPAEYHYYQPLWTLVGGGIFQRETTAREMRRVMPKGVTWLRDRVSGFQPESNSISTDSGKTVLYRQLVVAPGIQLDWSKVKGLPEALGKDGVCSNYSYQTVPYTWEAVSKLSSGNALFTFPATPIKCAGAPQKAMYLSEEAFRRRGVRDRIAVKYVSATAGIFGIPKYAAPLREIVKERNIETEFQRDLVEIRPATKEAVFRSTSGESELVLNYDLIHVVPPQSAPDFVKRSPLAGDGGWVEVDRHTLQHTRFPNVFSLGDASSLPCSKTGAAIRKQAPVLVANLLAFRDARPLPASYDGYASCPLVTGYGKVMLAEFGYDGKIMETFPFDQAEERYTMYALKAYALPSLYWHGMLKGRA